MPDTASSSSACGSNRHDILRPELEPTAQRYAQRAPTRS
jgi:hypothetical protein